MKLTTYLYACAILAVVTTALPVRMAGLPSSAEIDARALYTSSLPEKRESVEPLDADERVVYTWSLPEEKAGV